MGALMEWLPAAIGAIRGALAVPDHPWGML